jgi:hypothetical protein
MTITICNRFYKLNNNIDSIYKINNRLKLKKSVRRKMKFYSKSMMKASASISTRTSGVIRRLTSTMVVAGRIF